MNLAWAKEWIGEFGAPEKIRSKYADRVDFEDVTFGHKETTGDGVKNFFASFTQDGGEHSFIVRNYSGGPEGGAVEWTWHAKHASDLMGASAKGKETHVNGVSVLRFAGGKIVEQRDYWDAATMLRQLGALK